MKRWHILQNIEKKIATTSEVIDGLFEIRGIKKDEREVFLNPDINLYNPESVGIDKQQLKKFRKRMEQAVKSQEKIVIFGDYDVDGICATAILWETLFSKTKNVVPYIPDRIDEGYGLSIKGVENVISLHPDASIIITVDNGIVAYDAIAFAQEKGLEVIVTDHHVKGAKSPGSDIVIHTTSLCGAGIAWFLARELGFETKEKVEEKLELAALATVADLVPLINANRAIVKKGLEILKNTTRPGLVELLKEAAVDRKTIGVYTIGYIIAPRLNAAGRIESGMNGLRLLCTRKPEKAKEFASLLSNINRERQGLTEEAVAHAKLLAIENTMVSRVTVVAHETYKQGIIGLVASQLVESYYRPSFAIAKGETISKGSARSIKGVNIIELLRSVGDTLLEAGGHPMAAGFSIETAKIEEFITALSKKAEEVVTDELLKRMTTVDMFLPFQLISKELVGELSQLAPFGMGNPEPVFATENVIILEVRKIGKEQNHLKMKLESEGKIFDAIAFRMADKVDVLPGDTVAIAYTIDENEWNGRVSLQLKIRDLTPALADHTQPPV